MQIEKERYAVKAQLKPMCLIILYILENEADFLLGIVKGIKGGSGHDFVIITITRDGTKKQINGPKNEIMGTTIDFVYGEEGLLSTFFQYERILAENKSLL